METANPRPGYMRPQEAARFCGVSLRTIAEWQHRHLIPFVKISHKVVLFKVSEIEKALDRLTVKAVSQ